MTASSTFQIPMLALPWVAQSTAKLAPSGAFIPSLRITGTSCSSPSAFLTGLLPEQFSLHLVFLSFTTEGAMARPLDPDGRQALWQSINQRGIINRLINRELLWHLFPSPWDGTARYHARGPRHSPCGGRWGRSDRTRHSGSGGCRGRGSGRIRR